MSSLWTPEGEHPVGHERQTRRSEQSAPAQRSDAAAGREPPEAPSDDLSGEDEERVAAHLEELRRQLMSTPAEIVVANHAYGLFELAAIHLSQQPPRLEEARLAIDALAAVVEGLEGRLGEPERSLRDALAQIRLAFVQIGGTSAAADGEPGTESP